MSKRQVSIFINGRAVTNSLKAIKAEKGKINRELQNMILHSDEYNKKADELDKINAKLNTHRRKIGQTSGVLEKVTGGLTKFAGIAGIAFGVGEIIGYGKELFQLNVKMEQLTKKAATVFGQALPKVTRAAEENGAAMGFTTGQYIAAATALGDLLIPLGFTREQAAANSVEMINLAGALSEWTGGQRTAEEVSQTLAKALTGEREELKSLGIVINEEDIKMRLREKGLEKLTGQYLKQAKALATLELITERSVDAQTAYAENSDTLARRQAELAAKVSDVQAKFAKVLLPVLETAFSMIEDGVNVMTAFSDSLNRLTNAAGAAGDSFKDQQAAVNDLESNILPLIDRYDELTGKSTLTKDEQDELEQIIKKVGDRIPSTINQFDEYGEAMGLSSDKAREFVKSQQAILGVKNAEAIDEYESSLSKLEAKAERYRQTLEGTGVGLANITMQNGELVRSSGNLGGVSYRRLREDEVAELQNEFIRLNTAIEGTKGALAELKGNPLDIPKPDLPTGGDEPDLEAEAKAAAEAKARKKAAEKALKDRRKQLERLAGVIAKAQEDAALDQLSEDERQLEQIRLKYEKQIAIANELENAGFQAATAQRLELERLRDAEITAVRDELFAAKLEKDAERDAEEEAARLERQLKFDEDRRAVIAEIDEQVNEVVLDSRQLAIEQLNEHYDELATKAQEFGIDTGALEIARRRELLKINKDYDGKEAKNRQATQDAQIAATKASYQALAGVVSTAYNDLLTEQEKATGVGKLLALINIGVNSAEAISSAAAASAGVPFPGNLAAIATSVSTVLGAMGQARRALNATPDVPQRKDGGWMTVRGEDDKQSYRAKRIGTPGSGMLPDHPVLIDSATGANVLASERGREYFVANHDLTNPAVFRHVNAIDRLVRQRVDGGFSTAGGGNAPGGVAPTLSADGGNGQQLQLDQLTNTLNGLLDFFLTGNIYALITDEGALDLRNKIRELEAASSGGLN